MVDRFLRLPKERLLTPVAVPLVGAIHPTTVTLIAAVVGVAAGVAAWRQWYDLALVLWLANRVLDGLDGTLARLQRRQTDLGGYIDIVLDTVVYAWIPLGIALADGRPLALTILALLLGSFYINAASWMYLSALLEKQRNGAQARGELTTVTMPGGLIEGTETIVFYTLFLLFPGAVLPLFAVMAALVLVTVVQRLAWARRYL